MVRRGPFLQPAKLLWPYILFLDTQRRAENQDRIHEGVGCKPPFPLPLMEWHLILYQDFTLDAAGEENCEKINNNSKNLQTFRRKKSVSLQ